MGSGDPVTARLDSILEALKAILTELRSMSRFTSEDWAEQGAIAQRVLILEERLKRRRVARRKRISGG